MLTVTHTLVFPHFSAKYYRRMSDKPKVLQCKNCQQTHDEVVFIVETPHCTVCYKHTSIMAAVTVQYVTKMHAVCILILCHCGTGCKWSMCLSGCASLGSVTPRYHADGKNETAESVCAIA